MSLAHATSCPLPCATMGISFGIPIHSNDDIDSNLAHVKLYFRSQINVRSSVYSYSIASLIADIGGYLGLLLGFSVLDLTSVVKQFLFSSWKKLHYKIKSGRAAKNKQNEMK